MTDLGNKHECLGCGAKFYDLGKSELICPKCGENQKELAETQNGAAGKETSRKKEIFQGQSQKEGTGQEEGQGCEEVGKGVERRRQREVAPIPSWLPWAWAATSAPGKRLFASPSAR